MKAKEIDFLITNCPYFGGTETINRKVFDDGLTHVGCCYLEHHYRPICPSEECICAKQFGLAKVK